MKLYFDYLPTPLGTLTAASLGTHIVRIILPRENRPVHTDWLAREYPDAILERDSSPFTELRGQIDAYFTRGLRTFSVPVMLTGTPFRKSVWNAMKTIPFGTCASYSDLAEMAGSRRAARAAGNACNANPLPVIIPCHRVIQRSGGLGGFGGGIAMKKKLLRHEGVTVTPGNKVVW